MHREVCQTKLSLRRGLDLASKEVRHELHAVADSEDRNPRLEQGDVNQRCALGIDRVRAARKHDPFDTVEFIQSRGLEARLDLAVDVGFTDPAGDQLGVLGPEVQNQDLLPGIHWGAPMRPSRGSSIKVEIRAVRSPWPEPQSSVLP